MSYEWNFDLDTKLEKILLNLVETGPKYLREIADELGINLENDSDKNKLRYRIRKTVHKYDELQDFGYTDKGYIIAIYKDEFKKISKPLRSRGVGMLVRAKNLDHRAETVGKRRKNSVEQIKLFDDTSEETS